MLPRSNHGKTCLETMRRWGFTTSPPPSKIPHHNSSNSWIIFWKSWVIFWILIWTQDGEMASSLNFRFLLCNGGQTLQCFLHLLLRVQHAETWEPFWGTCNDEMRWYPFWPQIIGKVHCSWIFLGHKRISHDGKIPWVWVSTVCLHNSARGREQRRSSLGAFSWRYNMGNFSFGLVAVCRF